MTPAAHVIDCTTYEAARQFVWGHGEFRCNYKIEIGTPLYLHPSPEAAAVAEELESLLTRIRPNSEAAPWVIDKLRELAARLNQ